jgi:N-methylhydantoinase A/oxoprolinase/acetone carboxylase beta subunit
VKLIGVDIGGTFTDIILADTATGATAIHKLPTTTADPSQGMVRGILELCRRAELAPAALGHVFHGTTIATNLMLEYRGAPVGMITTEGYRDVVHIGRHQRPQHYSIMQDIPWQSRPLARRRHRKVVPERLVPPRGDVLVPLDEEAVRRAARELREEGVASIAICFLFSYLNPVHEERAREIVAEAYPEAFVTTSASIFPQFREFERFTTALINAFVGPEVTRYVDNLASSLRAAGIEAELHVMRSNGGVATARSAAEKPVTLLLSGPAAGILGGAWAGALSDRRSLITFDVGGTSADIGIVTPRGIGEASARDTWIAGYPVMVPMIDVHTIGAGGGSIAYVDRGGAFRVGPRSAGAAPGPACYGQGGQAATVIDANVVLGRLDPGAFLGGQIALYPERAEAAIDRLAGALDLDRHAAAEGVVTIVNNNMANAIRSRTIEKGHDPRGFTLVAFGGAGALHAAEVAAALDIPEVIVPPYPGITSAMGLLTTDLKYDHVRTEFVVGAAADPAALNGHLAELEARVRAELRRDGVEGDRVTVERAADCRYVGQGYELRIAIPEQSLDAAGLARLWERFHAQHLSEYGQSFPANPVELVALRVAGVGSMPKLGAVAPPAGADLDDALVRVGEAWFPTADGLRGRPTRHLDRARLPVDRPIDGPAIVLQTDSTTVVPPDWTAVADRGGNLILRRRAAVSPSTPRPAQEALRG